MEQYLLASEESPADGAATCSTFGRFLRRTAKAVAALLLLPVVIPATLLGLLGIIVALTPAFLWESIRSRSERRSWLRELGAQGRWRAETLDDLNEPTGTLIVDSRTIGCNVSRLWWTSDDVRDMWSEDLPTDEERHDYMMGELGVLVHPFDEWCYDRYLSENSGTALLLSPQRGRETAERLRQEDERWKHARCWSGPVLMKRWNDEQNEKQQS